MKNSVEGTMSTLQSINKKLPLNKQVMFQPQTLLHMTVPNSTSSSLQFILQKFATCQIFKDYSTLGVRYRDLHARVY